MTTFTSKQTSEAFDESMKASPSDLGRQAMEWPAAVVSLDLQADVNTLHFATETIVNIVEWVRDLGFGSDQINEALHRANVQANTDGTVKVAIG